MKVAHYSIFSGDSGEMPRFTSKATSLLLLDEFQVVAFMFHHSLFGF